MKEGMKERRIIKMGRKRLWNKKKTVGLSIDPQLLEELNKDGVNKSRLFSIFAKKYLRKKRDKIGN